MKNIKYYIIILTIMTFISCDSEENNPEVCSYIVTTNEAFEIGNNSANFSYNVSPDYYGYSGILLSTTSSFNNPIKLEGNSSSYKVYASNLTKNTTYYFKAYAEDNYESRIYGKTLSFKTSNNLASVTTSSAQKTAGRHSLSGYYHNGYNYKYEFDWIASMMLVDIDDIIECGFQLGDAKFPSTVKEGIVTGSFTTWSNSSSIYQDYKAYAKLKDGNYIYGAVKTIFLNY